MGFGGTHHIVSNRVNRSLQRKNRSRFVDRRDDLFLNTSSSKKGKSTLPSREKKSFVVTEENGLFSSREIAGFKELAILLAIIVPVVVWLLVTYIA